MKTKFEIEHRLKRLRNKYTKKYVAESQSRCHQNCLYNRLHSPTGSYSNSKSIDVSMASKKQITLVVIQPESPIRLCMYGSENPSSWLGDICDNDDIAKSCKVFEPAISPDTAREDFLSILSDDEYVFENYRDIAALQWVLNDRLHKMKLSWMDRLVFKIQNFFFKKSKPVARLEPGPIPDNLWDENDS